jgi:hypothetical protein
MMLGLLFASSAALRAQDIPKPPDLWNLGTGEKIPAADIYQTKDFGAIANPQPSFQQWGRWRMIEVQTPDGLQQGDIILAVDGLRIFGSREFELARFRNPLSTSMTLLVNRKGDLQWVKFHDLQPGRSLDVSFDTDAEQDRILSAFESLGLPLADDTVRDALRQLPAQSAMELNQWGKKNQSADTSWVQDFIDLFMAVQGRHFANATKPAHEPPIPYFQKLEQFYLTLADQNQPKEVPPDLTKSGVLPEFYVLALPVPNYQPPLGAVKSSDRRFQSLLLRKYALFGRSDQELVTAAQKYATSGSDGLDLYIDQVRASLIDPDNQQMLPFESSLRQGGAGRTLLQQALAERLKDTNSIDWPVDAYAMIALDWANGNADQIAPLVDDLNKRSPYLARSAMEGLYFIRHARRSPWRLLRPAMNLMAKNNNFLGPDVPALYPWALDKIQPLATSLGLADGNPLPNPNFLLTDTPYAELLALKNSATPAATPVPSPAPVAAK